MNAEQVVAIRTLIKEAYPYVKMNDETGDEVWYVLLKEYKFKPMQEAVINFIKSGNKFAPSVGELIKLYSSFDKVKLNDVVQYMAERGYFDDPKGTPAETATWNREKRLDKTMRFIESGNVPDWLQQDINKYYREMNPQKLGNNQHKQIGEGT